MWFDVALRMDNKRELDLKVQRAKRLVMGLEVHKDIVKKADCLD